MPQRTLSDTTFPDEEHNKDEEGWHAKCWIILLIFLNFYFLFYLYNKSTFTNRELEVCRYQNLKYVDKVKFYCSMQKSIVDTSLAGT